MWPFSKRKNVKAREPTEKTRSSPPDDASHVSRTRADVSLTGSEAIYAAVSRISNTMASLPLHLYKGYELQEDDPLEKMVAYSPTVNNTPFTFIQTMEAFRNTEGRAYAFMVPNENDTAITQLDIIDPTKVTPIRIVETREVWYRMTPERGQDIYVPSCRMIVLKHMSANGEMGVRPLDVLRGTLDYDKQIKDFSLNQLEGVNNGVVLNVPGTGLSEDRKKKIIEQFLNAYRDSGGRLVVLEGGVTATTLSQSPVDAKVLDVERITKNRVATVYNIPPHLLGDYTDTSFATAEQQMQEYRILTILPIVKQWEHEFNRKLLTHKRYADGFRFRFDMDELARGDTAAMADKNQKGIRGGWIKPNEARRKDGLPPDPYGDELMASRDLIPLRIALEKPELLLGKGNLPKGGEETA